MYTTVRETHTHILKNNKNEEVDQKHVHAHDHFKFVVAIDMLVET